MSADNFKNIRSYNLDRWGADIEHNTLYITGYSGSGKSLFSRVIRYHRLDTVAVHLDLFLEPNVGKTDLSPEFQEYLDKHFPDYKRIYEDKEIKGTSKRGELLERFEGCLEGFSEELFNEEKRLVIEGVHLYHEMLYPYKEYFRDKPMILFKTNPIIAFYRSVKRDHINLFKNWDTVIKYIKWYFRSYRLLCNLNDIMRRKER